MKLFLSAAQADKALAERLREELEAYGASISADWELAGQGGSWQERIEQAIGAAEAILLVIHPRAKPDPAQDFAWRAALEAVWAEPQKRLIPILLHDAKLPTFVRSASQGQIQAVRIQEPKSLQTAARSILWSLGPNGIISRALGLRDDAPRPRSRELPLEDEPFGPKSGLEVYSEQSEEEAARRQERLAEIREFAEQLKQ